MKPPVACSTFEALGLALHVRTSNETPRRCILSDTIEAVEYDFGLRLSIMLGQVWSQTGHQALSDLIKAERDLFKTWWRQGHQGVHTFSQLYLWSMGERVVDLLAFACSSLAFAADGGDLNKEQKTAMQIVSLCAFKIKKYYLLKK